MTEQKPNISLQDVTEWSLGVADANVKQRIENDLKRPDSLVHEYLEWEGNEANRSLPRLVETNFMAAGGRKTFVERLLKAIEPLTDRKKGR